MSLCRITTPAVILGAVLGSLCRLHPACLADDETSTIRTTITGRVLDATGNPVPEAQVVVRYRGEPAESVTGPDGRFSVEVPTTSLRGAMIVALTPDHQLMGHHQLPWDASAALTEPLKITLKPAQRITIHVTDDQGLPIAGANTGVLAGNQKWDTRQTDDKGQATHALPQDVMLRTIYAWKSGRGVDYRTLYDPKRMRQGQSQEEVDLSEPFRFTLSDPVTVDVKVVDAENGAPIVGTTVYPWLLQKPGEPENLNLSFFADEVRAKTDEAGIARFDWLPAWNERESLTFWPTADGYVHQRGTYEYATGEGALTIELHKLVPVSGQARLPDGAPAAGITISAVGEGYSFDSFRRAATTDEQGRYEIMAAPNMVYLMVVTDETWAAAPQTGFAVLPGEPRDGLDFDLRPATRIYGRVTMGPDEKPVAGQSIQSYQSGLGAGEIDGLTLPNPENSRTSTRPYFVRYTNTDDDGRFELFVGSGNYDLRGPSQNEIEKFTVTDETELEFNFHTPRPEEGPLTGLVVGGDPPQPVPDAKVSGIYRHPLAGGDLDITTDAEGRFDVERKLHRTVMYAQSAEGLQAGVVEIGPGEENVTIPIAPVASATGTLIDAETDQPLPGEEIVYGVRVHIGDDNAPWRTSFGGKTTTDADGQFRLSGLLVGQQYRINVTNEDGRSWRHLYEHTPESAAEVVLGELRLAPPPAPYRPPTLDERIAEAFQPGNRLPATRLKALLRDAQLGTLRGLLIFADPDSDHTRAFFKVRDKDRDVRTALYDYRILALPTAGDRAQESLALATDLGLTFDNFQRPHLAVLSADGELLAKVTTADFESEDELDGQKLLDFLEHHRFPPRDARQLLNDALARAKAENKRVFVQETASWCAPCWVLSRFLHRHREAFGQDYIHVKIDHRWRHAREVMDDIEPDNRGGVPWSAILDADGNVLADSNGPDGNIGFPSQPASITHFLSMLRETRIRLTDEELATLEADLKNR